jgi:hypothetical protein
MKLRLFLAAAAVTLAAASPALGQRTISQGMTPAQVRAEFGAPAATRASDGWTYWYYHNGCPNRCGSDDVVFFREDRVVAAVLRTQRRRFAGPRANDALEPYDNVTAAGGAMAVPAGEQEPIQMRVRRRATDEAADAEAARDEADIEARNRAPARVGGVRIDGNRPAEAEDGSTIIVRPPARDGSAGARPAPTGTRTFGAVRDSAQGPPATAVDDERRVREGRVEPNTVRTTAIPDTAQSDRRSRERGVEPRVVPRNP